MRFWLYRALHEVVINKKYSNLYLRNHLSELDKKDRALATQIFYGTIQNYRYCEYAWKRHVKRRVSRRIQVLLTMSTYQLLFLDKVPNYAIVNDAVTIAKQIEPHARGFVNAVLHTTDSAVFEWPQDPIEKLALMYSCPEWLVKMWIAQYGYQQALENARSTVHRLPIYVRRNPAKISAEAFISCKTIRKTNYGVYEYTGHSIMNDPLYIKGMMSVQDAGSYQISSWMDAKPGDVILDCCAAPGTKSFAMAEMMHDQGRIDSIDVYEHRVRLIQNDCRRLDIHCVHPMVMDAEDLSELGLYDKVLCDVPCSGYGVLSRKPDIKLHMESGDMDTLIPLQQNILSSASKHVKPDGTIVYSTCTLNKKENEKQVERFIRNHPAFERIKMKTIFPNNQTDGFFMALMKLNKSLI